MNHNTAELSSVTDARDDAKSLNVCISGLTTQAQRRRPQDAPIATATARRRSLQRMVEQSRFAAVANARLDLGLRYFY